ncbi:ribonuclease domain-containing protein [Krasilnikovia sp. MM14-A1259]|uniref:ribonuclease domain-containing protein n=1 Tax=Krasilnikovia sp. MM14-A1259 TaxID=3373539 RepID=UPI0037FC0197
MTIALHEWLRRVSLGAALAVTSIVTYAPAAHAAVNDTCNIAGCAGAQTAYQGWSGLGWPTRRGWYDWPAGQCSFAGGEYDNDDAQLPGNDTFWEYDVYPRACGAHRDAYRIVVDASTGQTWYSPDHYSDFYEIV